MTPNSGLPATYRALLAFVENLAKQPTVAEIEDTGDEPSGDDYEGAYDSIVLEARQLLGSPSGDSGD